MLNQTVICGRLVKDPEVRELENGGNIGNITLAVPRSYKNVNGEYETDFINCTLFDSAAKNVSEYLKKGDLVGVKGRIQNKQYETENGKQSRLQLVVEKISFLAKAKENNNQMEM